MASIVKAIPNDDYTVTIELSNHHQIIYDLRPRLHSTRFCGLSDLNKFRMVRVEHANTLVWNNMCQIAIDEIIDMVGR